MDMCRGAQRFSIYGIVVEEGERFRCQWLPACCRDFKRHPCSSTAAACAARPGLVVCRHLSIIVITARCSALCYFYAFFYDSCTRSTGIPLHTVLPSSTALVNTRDLVLDDGSNAMARSDNDDVDDHGFMHADDPCMPPICLHHTPCGTYPQQRPCRFHPQARPGSRWRHHVGGGTGGKAGIQAGVPAAEVRGSLVTCTRSPTPGCLVTSYLGDACDALHQPGCCASFCNAAFLEVGTAGFLLGVTDVSLTWH